MRTMPDTTHDPDSYPRASYGRNAISDSKVASFQWHHLWARAQLIVTSPNYADLKIHVPIQFRLQASS